MRKFRRRARLEIYTRQRMMMMRLKDMYGVVAVGGRRHLTSRVFIEAVHVFLE
jgi:hypothetical protein